MFTALYRCLSNYSTIQLASTPLRFGARSASPAPSLDRFSDIAARYPTLDQQRFSTPLRFNGPTTPQTQATNEHDDNKRHRFSEHTTIAQQQNRFENRRKRYPEIACPLTPSRSNTITAVRAQNRCAKSDPEFRPLIGNLAVSLHVSAYALSTYTCNSVHTWTRTSTLRYGGAV